MDSLRAVLTEKTLMHFFVHKRFLLLFAINYFVLSKVFLHME